MRRESIDIEKSPPATDEYEAYFSPIYRFAFRLLGNGADAKDITHEAFLSLLSSRTSGKVILNPRAWLYRAAANACYDRLRGRGIFYKIAGSWLEQAAPVALPEREMESRQEIARVRAALGFLPVRQRVILMLHQDGLSYAEIAAAAGVRKSSIGKLLARGMKRLAENLNNGDAV